MQPGTTGLRYIQTQYTDVPCTIEVRVAMPQAGSIGTSKAFASALPEVQADVAHLRRIGGGNEMHHHTSRLGLIGHKGAQLVEGPTVAFAAFGLLPGLLVGALPDTGQIFQGDAAPRLHWQCQSGSVLISLFVWR